MLAHLYKLNLSTIHYDMLAHLCKLNLSIIHYNMLVHLYKFNLSTSSFVKNLVLVKSSEKNIRLFLNGSGKNLSKIALLYMAILTFTSCII